MSFLRSHLKTLDRLRDLAEVEAKTHNLVTELAHTDPNDTAAQADLGTMIDLHEIYIGALKANIELAEEWEDFPDKPDRGGRRKILEQAVRDWDDAIPLFQEKGREVQERLKAWKKAKERSDLERESKQIEAAQPPADPARPVLEPSLTNMALKPPSEPQPVPIKRTEWKGLVWEFGEYVERLFKDGKIPGARSFADALKHMCNIYEKDGKQMTPRNVQQSLNQRREGVRCVRSRQSKPN